MIKIKDKGQKKIIIFFTVSLIIISFFLYKVNAFSFEDLSGTTYSGSDAKDLGNKIITTISTIGSIVSVTVLVIIGVKYMFGSIEERVEYKKSLLPYLIGSMVVFGASVFSSVIFNVIKDF